MIKGDMEYVLLKTDNQKDGPYFHVMEKSEAEKKVKEWGKYTNFCNEVKIIQNVTYDIKKIIDKLPKGNLTNIA